MLLELNDISPLKNFFDVIYDTVQIVEMRLDQEKLSISLLNNSHVAFYNLEISKYFFLTYDVIDNESILIFVEDFYKILKSAGKDDYLSLETNDSYLICTFEKNNGRRVFELPLAEDYGESPLPPSIDYDGVINLYLNDLKQPCDDLDKIVKTDRFKMIADDYKVNIIAPNDAMTKYNQILSIDDDIKGNVIVNVDYIKQLVSLSKINDIVSLRIGDSIPLSWNISSDDGLVDVSGMIAPIIEEDE